MVGGELLQYTIILLRQITLLCFAEVQTYHAHEVDDFGDVKPFALGIQQMQIEFVVEYFRHFGVLFSVQAEFGIIQARKQVVRIDLYASLRDGFRFLAFANPRIGDREIIVELR